MHRSRKLSVTAGVTAGTLAVAAVGLTALINSSSANAATIPPKLPVSVARTGVVVAVPVHPAQLLRDARTALRITRQILKKFPHVKILSIAPRQGGGFTVRVLISPRRTGTVIVDKNFHVGSLIPSTIPSTLRPMTTRKGS